MDIQVKVLGVVTGMVSLYLLYRLHTRPGHWLEKLALTVLLMVPFVGWIAYLFVVEEVPPQADDLQNQGPRGFYTDRMITRTRPDPDDGDDAGNKPNP